MRQIRVGIIGCGMITRTFHVPAIVRFPELKIEAFSDINKSWADEMAVKYSAPYAFSDYGEMIGKIDMAIVATPNAYHTSISKELLKAGINVLCEKPMGISVEECEEVAKAEKDSNAIFMVAHSRRFASNVMLLKKFLDEGKFGDLRNIELKLGHSHKQWITRSGFSFKKEQAGGGVLIDQGIHLIDLLIWFYDGEIKVVSIKGKDMLGYGMEDIVEAEFLLDNGGKAVISSSRVDEWENLCKIEGTKGWAHFHIDDKTYLLVESRKIRGCELLGAIQFKTPLTNIYQEQLKCFIKHIKKNKKPPISADEAIKGIRLMNYCYEKMELSK
ncbi:MAG: gfo/Idh/MocA family oxidoreductase [Candidatus Schekmanbacteria bacterium]|nr:MAG: gfo/Idh/MocA family oxidoreductase [Candidatus Schekmanbacteria bacterium]